MTEILSNQTYLFPIASRFKTKPAQGGGAAAGRASPLPEPFRKWRQRFLDLGAEKKRKAALFCAFCVEVLEKRRHEEWLRQGACPARRRPSALSRSVA